MVDTGERGNLPRHALVFKLRTRHDAVLDAAGRAISVQEFERQFQAAQPSITHKRVKDEEEDKDEDGGGQESRERARRSSHQQQLQQHHAKQRQQQQLPQSEAFITVTVQMLTGAAPLIKVRGRKKA